MVWRGFFGVAARSQTMPVFWCWWRCWKWWSFHLSHAVDTIFSKPNLAIVCLSWNVPVYKFPLGLELPKTHNDGMRTLNFGQRMSFSCFYGNGGKHKTDKKEHICQKKSANTFENSCVQNATKESHNFLMNFVPWTAWIRRSVIQSGPTSKSKGNLNQKNLQTI